jgi:hypothetical protein
MDPNRKSSSFLEHGEHIRSLKNLDLQMVGNRIPFYDLQTH